MWGLASSRVNTVQDDRPSQTTDGSCVDEVGGRSSGASRTSLLGRNGLTTTDGAIAGLAFLLCIAFGPPMSYPSWTPRMALVLVAAPAGLVTLIALMRRRNPAALSGAVFVAWVLLAGLVGGSPRSALLGFVGRDLSALLIVAAVGLWALGSRVSSQGQRLVVGAVLCGLSLSLLVGILQLMFDVRSGMFAMNGGRPSGLTSNPVYFGGVMVAAAGLSTGQLATTNRSSRRSWLLLVGLVGSFALGVSISGSRVALVALVVVVLGSWAGWRKSVLDAVIAAAIGLVGGSLLQNVFGSKSDAFSRAADVSGGLDGRFEVWRYGVGATLDRPFLGWGFGGFRESVQGEFSASFVAKYAQNDLGVAWFDAHNIVLGVANAVGFVGLGLAILWVWSAARGARVELVVFPLALLVTWTMQPAALATLPLAALMFGVSRSARVDLSIDDSDLTAARARRRVEIGAVVVGLAAGCYLVAADVAFYYSTDALSTEWTERTAALFPGDPVVAGLVAQVWALDQLANDHPDAIRWQQKAADRDPERPYWWARLAERQIVAGQYDAAGASLERALALQPFHYDSIRFRVTVAARQNDLAGLEMAIAAACEVEAPECALDAEELLLNLYGASTD